MIDNPKGSFLRIHRSVLLVSLLLVTSIAVSIYFGSFKSRPTRASIVSSPLEFSIELNKTMFLQGENVNVSVSMKNISNRTVTLKWGKHYSPDGQTVCFDFHVFDANKSLIYQWSQLHGALGSWKTIILNASQQWTNCFFWYQQFDYPQDLVKVPAGIYSIVGLSNRAGLTIDNETRAVELETPSVTFTIK